LIVYNNQNFGNPFRIQATKGFTQKGLQHRGFIKRKSLASFLFRHPGGGNTSARL